jgi:hypothetical protein
MFLLLFRLLFLAHLFVLFERMTRRLLNNRDSKVSWPK